MYNTALQISLQHTVKCKTEHNTRLRNEPNSKLGGPKLS